MVGILILFVLLVGIEFFGLQLIRCNSRGVAYVSFSQWVSVIIMYTFVYHMLEPPEEFYELVSDNSVDAEDGGGPEGGDDVGGVTLMPSVTSVEWPDVKDAQNEESRMPLLARMFRYPSLTSQPVSGFCLHILILHLLLLCQILVSVNYCSVFLQEGLCTISSGLCGCIVLNPNVMFWSIHAVNSTHNGEISPRGRVPCLAEPHVIRKMRVVAEKTPIQHMLQPPIIASLLAIAIGIFPHASSILFGDDAPLSWFTDSLTILGAALVPSVMLGLGSTLSGGPGDSDLGLRTMVGISFTRLVVLPPLGIGVVLLAHKLGMLPEGDKMYMFVLLLQHTMPTAILAGGMTRLRGYAEREASALLFWQHVFAVVPIAVYIVVYLKIVSYI
jgi:predicted permease